MISQTYLIYLGIAVVIIIIAFFAYQELQKHKMEIQKLRFQSEKLRKIVHAYNMQQWAQQTGYPEESETEEEEEEDEVEDEEEGEIQLTGEDARQAVNDILAEALSASQAHAGGQGQSPRPTNTNDEKNDEAPKEPQKVAPEAQVEEQVVTFDSAVTGGALDAVNSSTNVHEGHGEVRARGGVQIGPDIFMNTKPVRQEVDALPEIDTFDVDDEGLVVGNDAESESEEHHDDVPPEDERESEPEELNFGQAEGGEQVDEETTNVVFESNNENNKSSEEDTKTEKKEDMYCTARLKTNPDKICGKKAKLNGFCLTHFRSSGPEGVVAN